MVTAIDWLFQLASLLLVARVFVSWIFPGQRPNPIVDFIYRSTEPILAPIRHHVTQLMGYRMPIDISPMVGILLLLATRYVLVKIILLLL
ncbi:YggT family protein [Candidatus Bipolaricaulota bacterium]|nr:YggT family protein [Candidatus Bipolaricaulota bacterium]MBS3793220.1 YggT family protein [Candidatus Bipolaricaulota bacterium]